MTAPAGTSRHRTWYALSWIGRLVRDLAIGLAVQLARLILSAGAGLAAMELLAPTGDPLTRLGIGLAVGLPVLWGVNRLVRRWFR